MKILIIDDTVKNRMDALEQLPGHEITFANDFETALLYLANHVDVTEVNNLLKRNGFEPCYPDYQLYSMQLDMMETQDRAHEFHSLIYTAVAESGRLKCQFDMVLTDLYMPASSIGVAENFNPDELVPYGIILALKAVAKKIPKVAIVTCDNHHKGAFLQGLTRGLMYDNFPSLNGTKVIITTGMGNHTKNWKQAFNELMKDE